MQKGSKIYSLEALTKDPLATRNTILFAALTAMGIEPEPELCGEFVETVNGERRSITVWRLKECSADGKLRTAELIRLWEDPEFVARETEHPLAYLKTGFENYSRARDFIRDTGPIAMVRRGSRIGFVTNRTTPQRKEWILNKVNGKAAK